LFFLLPFANAQTYFPQIAKGTHNTHKITGDTIIIEPANIYVDYYWADSNKYHSNYVSQQTELMNKYYNFSTDTSNTFNTKNYECINSVTVAFDSLYDPYTNVSFSADTFISFGIKYIYIPIIQVHHSTQNDTLEVQLNSVDAYGYPTPNILLDTLFLADSTNHDSLGAGNDHTFKTLKWSLGNYFLAGTKFAVTVIYHDYTKQDSCWFIYGFHSFKDDTCPVFGSTPEALPTDFSKIPYPSSKLVANSFEIWNYYAGLTYPGGFPTEGGNNTFLQCDTNDKVFHPGIDGANYFQDIHIYIEDTASSYLGIKNINSPFSIISQNYPNPFNEKSTITYTINKVADVNFNITDITGRIILSQAYTKMNLGQHSIIVNATSLSPGVYFYTFSSSGSTLTKKMVVY